MAARTTLFIIGIVLAQAWGEYTDPHCGGKQTIVHLFEWKWSDIALECERFLAPKGFCGVQVSPVNEHTVITSPPYPWWQRYQPVSYILHSRSGTEAEFVDMVNRCQAVGVRIYADVILNHMAGLGRQGVGSAGSSFDTDQYDFPGVPYTKDHFNPYCELNSYNDANMIRNCYLVGLTDLDQGNEYVRNTLAEFLNKLIDLGVAGFRVDAAKHMWPKDITAIQDKLKDLPEGGRPFFVHEVIDQSNGPITAQQYTALGYVTEFRYCQKIKEGIEGFGRLGGVVDYGWGMLHSDHAFVFVDNHDNQRGHGGGGSIITFEKPRDYRMAVAFTLANDYGFTRVMSSYSFGDNNDQGPPHNADFSTKDVIINSDDTCGNGWVCEHRWKSIANMVAFRNAVVGTQKENYFNENDQIAFSRGSKGFFAMSRSGHMDQTMQTGLPSGQYCDLITECAKTVTVDSNGMAHIVIDNPDEPVLAIIIGGPISGSGSGSMSGSATSGPISTHSHMTVTKEATTSQTSDGATLTSPASTIPTNLPVGWARTIIMVEKETNGQDLFLRGGLDQGSHSGCSTDVNASPCVLPVRYVHQNTDPGFTNFYDKYLAWSVGDHYLDWFGSEPSQGRYHGTLAQGTPAMWTTNQQSHEGYNSLNTYGPNYWLVDLQIDCNRTDTGWFEIKAVVNGQWEGNIRSSACTGSGSPPGTTGNHWAQCGMLNVFHYESAACEIHPVP